MRISRPILLLLFLLFSSGVKSQLFDQIKSSLAEDPKIYFNWGSQYSFISGDFATIRNIKIGLDYGNITRFGIGYNWLSGAFPTRKGLYGGEIKDTRLNMQYLTLFAEYTFYRTDRWEASIPAQAGFGLAWNSYFIGHKEKVHLQPRFFILYEPVMTIQYRFLRYFGAGGGIGYRLIIINSSSLRETFTSPLLVLKTKLYLGEMWKDYTGRTRKRRQ